MFICLVGFNLHFIYTKITKGFCKNCVAIERICKRWHPGIPHHMNGEKRSNHKQCLIISFSEYFCECVDIFIYFSGWFHTIGTARSITSINCGFVSALYFALQILGKKVNDTVKVNKQRVKLNFFLSSKHNYWKWKSIYWRLKTMI